MSGNAVRESMIESTLGNVIRTQIASLQLLSAVFLTANFPIVSDVGGA